MDYSPTQARFVKLPKPTLTIVKRRRGHWAVETQKHLPYASIDLTSEYGNREYGWQVWLKDKDGRRMRHIGTFPRRGPATRAAMDALDAELPRHTQQ